MTSPVAIPAAPRYAFAWATLACVVAALTLAHPALGGGFLVNPVSDQYIAGFAFREFGAAALRESGSFPLWNPYLFGGMPYVAAMHGDIFYPTFLLRMALPTDVAMTWGMILHLMLAGIATYAFLRAIGMSFYASLVGGLAYMMSGQVASLVSPGHDGKLFVSALFPLTLLVLTWGIRDAKRWAWGLLAIVIGLCVLSPHPQLLQYLLLASGAWALMLAFSNVGGGTTTLPRRDALVRLGLALGAVVLGGAMGAIQYMPVAEYVPWSPRAAGKDYAYATSFSMPIEELINTYIPQFTGILDNYWGRNGIHFHSEYLGAGVLALAAAAFLRIKATESRKLLWFWVGTLIVSLLWALGGNTPFYQLVYAVVPGAKFFRAPSIMFFVTAFCVAMLAAMGTERVLAARVGRRFCLVVLGVGAGITLLASVGGLNQLALGIAQATPRGGDPALLDLVEANAPALVAGAWRSFLFLAVILGIIWAAGERRISSTIAGTALAVVTVADLWSIERLYFRFSEPAATIYASDAAIEYVKRETQPVRVIAMPLSDEFAPRDPAFAGDALMAHGIRIPTGYHGNELGRYQVFGGFDGRSWHNLGNPAFWGLANVKYFYTNVDSLPVPGARRVAGPARNAAGTTVWLHELPGDHPFAWVAPVIAKYPDASIADAVRQPNLPYRSVALIDTASTTPAVALTAMPAPLDLPVTASQYAPGRFTLELAAPAPAGSALVVSENYYPGWSAVVDGTPAKAERANLALMAVALPAGARKVEFTFDSPPYRRGKSITLVALVIALLAGGAGIFADRRGRGAHA